MLAHHSFKEENNQELATQDMNFKPIPLLNPFDPEWV